VTDAKVAALQAQIRALQVHVGAPKAPTLGKGKVMAKPVALPLGLSSLHHLRSLSTVCIWIGWAETR
jgi:hypothetical protein